MHIHLLSFVPSGISYFKENVVIKQLQELAWGTVSPIEAMLSQSVLIGWY
jgi:hypothetical protein